MASGAAVLGTALGGGAVYLALANAPAPPSPPVQVAPARQNASAGFEERRIAAIAATRDTVLGIKIHGQLVGAGVMLSAEGNLLTNYHVVEPILLHRVGMFPSADGDPARSEGLLVRFYDGRELPAQIHWADAAQDIAVLKVNAMRTGETFAFAPVGDSSALKVGQSVFAVGSPVGLEHTVSSGIVSALDRTQVLSGRRTTAIQLDANINFGNSGGPLFDLDGRLVGITTTRSRKGDGIGFAIPIERVQVLFRHYGDRRRWSHPGVLPDPEHEVAGLIQPLGFRSGLWIESIKSNERGAAQDPARSLQPGDVLVALRGKRFDDLGAGHLGRRRISSMLFSTVKALVPGDELELTVVRDGEVLDIKIPILALSVNLQARLGARWVLGMEIALEVDAPPRFSGFTVAAPARRLFRPFELNKIKNAHIVELQGRPVRSAADLADILFDLEQMANSESRRWVSVAFKDAQGTVWRTQKYPLMML